MKKGEDEDHLRRLYGRMTPIRTLEHGPGEVQRIADDIHEELHEERLKLRERKIVKLTEENQNYFSIKLPPLP